MPSKKKALKKKKVVIGVEVLPPPKKHVPANAFKPGNEYAKRWTKGMESPNKSGRPKDGLRLVSRALRVQLNMTAPNADCLACGLKPGSSWAQVVGAAMIRQASRGDVAAAKLILDATEKGTVRTDVPVDADGNPLPTPALNIIFTDTPTGEELLRQELLGPAAALPPGD